MVSPENEDDITVVIPDEARIPRSFKYAIEMKSDALDKLKEQCTFKPVIATKTLKHVEPKIYSGRGSQKPEFNVATPKRLDDTQYSSKSLTKIKGFNKSIERIKKAKYEK